MRRLSYALFLTAAISLNALTGCNNAVDAQTKPAATTEAEFNAEASWQEFEGTFRLMYAYIERANSIQMSNWHAPKLWFFQEFSADHLSSSAFAVFGNRE